MSRINQDKMKHYIELLPKFLSRQITPREATPFSFDAGFFNETEGYKKRIYSECREILSFSDWTEEMIGTGKIAELIEQSLDLAFNLIDQKYNKRVYISKLKENVKESERAFFDLYCNDNDEIAFNNVINLFGARYELLGFLFFLKDREKYLPIRPERFESSLALLNADVSCTKGCTWAHYLEFINTLEEVQDILMGELDIPVELIDAHSFVWWLPNIEDNHDIDANNQYRIASMYIRPVDRCKLSDKQQQADFRYFKDKYSWESLERLSDRELAYRLFAWRNGSLTFDVMAGVKFGNHGHPGQQPNNWLPARYDSSKKVWYKRGGLENVIKEDEAVEIAKKFADEFVSCQKEIESYDDFTSIDDYKRLETFLKKNNNSAVSGYNYYDNWFQKALVLLYPGYFCEFYTDAWKLCLLSAFQIKPEKSTFLNNGHIALVAKYGGYNNAYEFASAVYAKFGLLVDSKIYVYNLPDDGLKYVDIWKKNGVIGVNKANTLISQTEFKNESNADGTKTYSVIAVVNQGRLIGIIDDLKQENTDQKNGTYRRQRECRWHECFEKGIIIPASRDNSDKLFIKVEDHESLKIIFRNFFNLFFEDIDQAEQFIDFQKNILNEAVGVNKKRLAFVEKYRESFQTISKEDELVAGYKGSFCTALINELNGTDSITEINIEELPLFLSDGEIHYNPKWSENDAFHKLAWTTLRLIKEEYQNAEEIMTTESLPINYMLRISSLFHENDFLGVDSEEKIDCWLDYLGIEYDDEDNFFEKQHELLNWKEIHPPFCDADNYTFLRFLEEYVAEPQKPGEARKNHITYIPDDNPVSLHNEDLDDDYEKALSQSDLMELPAHYEYGDIAPREKNTEIIKEKTASDNHRDSKVAQNALAHANYLCEIDPTHETFLRRNSDRTYTESHHLIPMKYSDQFEYSLDTEVNIVSLCSHCHNLIHYGQNADSLIRILYKERKDYLEKAGIGVSESELLSLYGY